MPRPVVKGEPTSKPVAVVLQFVPSCKPMDAQVCGMIAFAETAFPGKERYCAAMLPDVAAEASTSGVSYQPGAVATAATGLLSQLKKANILFFQIGARRLPPYWLNRLLSRFSPRCAGVPGIFEPTPFHR